LADEPKDEKSKDLERNRFTARASRYARVGANVGGVAAKIASQRFLGFRGDRANNAAALASALGGLKGPLMKVAQLLSTIPDALPPEYATELSKLQSEAPPMGWPFVKRRMAAELGPEWETKFGAFSKTPAAAASLGQVHRGRAPDGMEIAAKLQYPDMQSAVEADLKQLGMIMSIFRRMSPEIDTREIQAEIGARLREELDYCREAKHAALYQELLADVPEVRVPRVRGELSTGRLLTLEWLEGAKLLTYKDRDLETRNRIAKAMFHAWWLPFARHGVIHGDPHLGNYTVFEDGGSPAGINLLDYGCIRIFPPRFVGGVVDLYRGLLENDEARVISAYQVWGFKNLSKPMIDALNIWARFIYGPLMDDRTRTIADGVAPAQYGRREAWRVKQAIREFGPVTVPREFVFMDRAAIGLGGVFLHLKAEMNFHRLFEEAIRDFSVDKVAARQAAALSGAGLPAAA
jgi:predicted unusual protein kinase regulating ubiquinone biosynthesis (AarF/ABC1/UbiB family)